MSNRSPREKASTVFIQRCWAYAFTSPILFIFIVLVLGYVTPHYSQINYTISRLAIEKYGWIQTLNFLQLSCSFLFAAYVFSRVMTTNDGKRVWVVSMYVCSFALVMFALFPTDPIDNIQISLRSLTGHGLIHFASLGLFFLATPFGIHAMRTTLRRQKNLSQLADFTYRIGYFAFFLCVIWVLFFLMGWFLEYRGLFQKIIVFICFIWYLRVLWSVRNMSNLSIQ